MPGFVELLKRHSKEVIDLEQGHADEFLRLLRETQDALRGRLLANDSNNPLDIFRLRSVEAETRALIDVLERKASGLYGAVNTESVELSLEHLGQEIDKLSRTFGAEPLKVALDAQKVLADPVRGLLANQFESSVERYGLDLLNGVRRRLFIGLRAGEPLRDVVKDIAGERGAFGAIGQSNAERLVRTEVSEAYNASHLQGYKQAKQVIPDLAETWVHLGSYKCEPCGQLHGTKRPASGYWTVAVGKKTRKVAAPPLHPRCACRTIVLRPSWRTQMLNAGYLDRQDAEERPSL